MTKILEQQLGGGGREKDKEGKDGMGENGELVKPRREDVQE